MSEERIKKINEVISAYFETNAKEDCVAVKNLMPSFIKAGIFVKDHRKGLPIRKVLRKLDQDNALDMIPLVYADRHEIDTYWYFIRSGADCAFIEENKRQTNKEKATEKREASDEFYVINLCDEILDRKASRQHTFKFLLGDLHKDKVTRTKLPLDAYYKDLNLVIEYMEKQHSESVEVIDKPRRKTISGVDRGEQRKIYDKRKKEVLTNKEINLINIDYSSFKVDSDKRIIRNHEHDVKVLKALLKAFVK